MVSPTEWDETNSVTEALSKGMKGKNYEKRIRFHEIQQCLNLVDLSKEHKVIGNKWILKVKRKLDWSIERYRVRLVEKYFTQEVGIDYEKIFSLVVKFIFIQLLLAIIARLDLELH